MVINYKVHVIGTKGITNESNNKVQIITFLVLIIRITYKNISFIFNHLSQDVSLFESILIVIKDYTYTRKERRGKEDV